MLPDTNYPPPTQNKELKNSQKSKQKSQHNDFYQLPQISEISDKSLKSSHKRKISLATLVTNDEAKQGSNKDEQPPQQQQISFIVDDTDDDDGLDVETDANVVVKLMNTYEEVTMSLTTTATATFDGNDINNKQYETTAMTTTSNTCYNTNRQQSNVCHAGYISPHVGDVRGVGIAGVGCLADDSNNHSNSYDDKRQKVMDDVDNDNNTNAASNNNNANKQMPDTEATLMTASMANNNNNNSDGDDNIKYYEYHHKVSNKIIDSDEASENTYNDQHCMPTVVVPCNVGTDVVDNCNADNAKYNEHHKTFASVASLAAAAAATPSTGTQAPAPASAPATATPYMPLSIKSEYVAELTTLPSLLMPSDVATIPFSSSSSSFENCENHKIPSNEIHQPAALSSYDFLQSYHQQQHQQQQQYYHQYHHPQQQQHQYFREHYQPQLPQQTYRNVCAAPTPSVLEKNYGVCSSNGKGELAATTSLTICELASPRCQSRESNASISANNDARCPSTESHYSANDTHTSGQTPTPTTPPVALPLPATLPPAAAAALLPPQSAAMAAYFNAAAAAAAQQNHLLLTNPLAAAASLVQQATQQQQQHHHHQQQQQQQQQQHQQSSHSPNSQQASTPTPPATATTGDMADTSVLDFSTKRCRRNSNDEDDEDGNASDDAGTGACKADGVGVGGATNDNDGDNGNDNETDDVNSPLDLSLNNGRKRQCVENEEEPVMMPHRKLARSNDYKSLPASSTWVPPINPYLAAVAAASMSPKTPLSLDWNAKTKISPNEATKALEKMTEMTRLGGAAAGEQETPTRHTVSAASSNSSAGTPSNGRHSAWQSHWLNKGADAVKDVFKCVWCKQSFATLASLTTHMKETQHCGVNVPPSVAAANNAAQAHAGGGGGGGVGSLASQAPPSSHHGRHSTTQSASAHSPASSGKSDLNMLIKETMPLPRKLVRGQDVWLGKGAEQTRQILKCMWCGQSFRSLAEMTSHMQETQHYTNIISQEQIISWKSTDDKGSRDNSSCGSSNRGCPSTTSANTNPASLAAPSPNPSAAGSGNANVTAVLTCKVCDQAFPTLKELSTHMVKNNHYTEHMMRTNTPVASASTGITPSAGESAPTMIRSRSRQGREKRKKSLPVRKLLEMERAQQDFKATNIEQALIPLREFKATTKLQCDTCGEKFGLDIFVEHIRQCITIATERTMSIERAMAQAQSNEELLKSTYLQPPMMPDFTNINATTTTSPQTPITRSDSRKTVEETTSPLSAAGRADILCPLPSDSDKSSSGTSVLNALEQLIEKSFDARPRHAAAYGEGSTTPLGSSILKRLGIDDNVDYTKPLMDPQTMQFLRSYSSYAPSSRDRSASESSSISERCSSRLESFTPDRNYEQSRQPTPRLTPDKATLSATKESSYPLRIKSEPLENSEVVGEVENIPMNEMPKKISVKKEFSMTDEHEDYNNAKGKEADIRRNSTTPGSRSPSISERSITPKSVASVGDRKPIVGLPESSSLNALSSMFNNLSNMHTNASITAANMEMNNNNNNNNTCFSAKPKKTNGNPLAALQKLCDTTEKPTAGNARSSSANLMGHSASSNSSSNGPSVTTASATSANANSGMLAFSWACNDAVVTADSIIKCSFCDTPFSSRGAYRHHLSKVHFVKDEPDVISLKSPGSLTAASPKSHTTSPKSITSSKSPASQRLDATPPSSGMQAAATTVAAVSGPAINPYDESPQSKFLKYTELAKQLSSKNA